jgi:hypothetical protein
MIPKIHFFVISGQHLAEAARVICHNARKDPEKYGAVAERQKLKRAKIIDGACLQGSLIKYSDAMNLGKKELGSFTSPFHHMVEHVHNQYIACRRPARPSTVLKGAERKKAKEQLKVS